MFPQYLLLGYYWVTFMKKEFDIYLIEETFQHFYPGLEFSDTFIDSIFNNFSEYFNDSTLAKFMGSACERTEDPDSAIRYFCGICWKRIKNYQHNDPNFKPVESTLAKNNGTPLTASKTLH